MTAATAPYPAPDIVAAVARGLVAANDQPNPDFDAGCSPQKYAGMAQDFRASAWEHLDKDNLPQASNKAWGLVAETVKAISTYHGGIIHTHRALWIVTTALARLVGDAGDMATRHWINNSFAAARGLHSNFYENRAPEDDVLARLILCDEFSQRLYELFGPEGRRQMTPVSAAGRLASSRRPGPCG